MGYQDAVAQAADALKRGEDANWELARLTFENTITGRGYRDQPGKVTMEQWCADVRDRSGRKFSPGSGERYKRIWQRYGDLPSQQKELPAWVDAYYEDEAYVPQPFMEASAQRVASSASPEIKRDLAAKLMADPIVADAVISQPEPRRAVYEALNRREQTAEQRRERMTDADPVSSELRGLNALLDLSQIIERFVGDFSRVFQQAAQLPESDAFASRTFLTLQLERLQECTDRLRSYLETGKTDIDAFLDSVLKGS